MFIQTDFAVDPPTACCLVWTAGYMKTDLTDQLAWWCLHKLAVISTSVGSHLSQRDFSLKQQPHCTFMSGSKLTCAVSLCGQLTHSENELLTLLLPL